MVGNDHFDGGLTDEDFEDIIVNTGSLESCISYLKVAREAFERGQVESIMESKENDAVASSQVGPLLTRQQQLYLAATYLERDATILKLRLLLNWVTVMVSLFGYVSVERFAPLLSEATVGYCRMMRLSGGSWATAPSASKAYLTGKVETVLGDIEMCRNCFSLTSVRIMKRVYLGME